jgi:hypothetical protein
MTKKFEKFTAEKKSLFLSKTTFYLSLGLHKRTPSYRGRTSALKREYPALQNMKFLFFLFCGSLALLDPDPDSESGYGSTDLLESGSGSETLLRSH